MSMTKEEFKEKLEKIKKEMTAKKNEVYIKYAYENNPYKIGQIIEDHFRRIKIEKIQTSKVLSLDGYSSCKYYGPSLTKNNKLFKNNKKEWMYQSNVLKTY